MNKDEFILKLQDELQSIPTDERESALKYYREYFDDAGVENEQQVISELESPADIAKGIKSDLGYADETVKETVKENIHTGEKGNASRGGTASQTAGPGYYHTGASTAGSPNAGASTAGTSNAGFSNSSTSNAGSPNAGPSENGQRIVNGNVKIGQSQFPLWAIILIAILFIPVIVPAASGIFGTGIGLVCAAVGIVIGFFAATIGILVSGIAILVWGIASIIAGALYTGILLIGLGLALIGLGLMFLTFSIQLAGVWIPQFIRWIVRTIKNGLNYSKVRKGEPA